MVSCWPQLGLNEWRLGVRPADTRRLPHFDSTPQPMYGNSHTQMPIYPHIHDYPNSTTLAPKPRGVHGPISRHVPHDGMKPFSNFKSDYFTSAVRPAGFGRASEKIGGPSKETLKVRLETIEFVWEVEEFKRLRRLAKMNALPVEGTKARSAVFGTETAGYWYLEMSPGQANLDDTTQENAAIWLCLDTTQTAEAMAEFQFVMLDTDHSVIDSFKKGSLNFQLFKANESVDACHGVEIDSHMIDMLVREGNITVKCVVTVFLGIGDMGNSDELDISTPMRSHMQATHAGTQSQSRGFTRVDDFGATQTREFSQSESFNINRPYSSPIPTKHVQTTTYAPKPVSSLKTVTQPSLRTPTNVQTHEKYFPVIYTEGAARTPYTQTSTPLTFTPQTQKRVGWSPTREEFNPRF